MEKSHPFLLMNEQISLRRLGSTLKKLERTNLMQQYHDVMNQQISDRILEPAPKHPTGDVVHYIPHKAVIREQAES